jgi:hypothetical protein
MKNLAVLWLKIYKLVQIFMCSYHTTAQLNPYCDLVCIGLEVGYVPAETFGEISLLCHQSNTDDY